MQSLQYSHFVYPLSKPKLYSISTEQQYIQGRNVTYNSREVPPLFWKMLRQNSTVDVEVFMLCFKMWNSKTTFSKIILGTNKASATHFYCL